MVFFMKLRLTTSQGLTTWASNVQALTTPARKMVGAGLLLLAAPVMGLFSDWMRG
jgi:hypothetical protein